MSKKKRDLVRSLAILARSAVHHCDLGLGLGDALLHGAADSLDDVASGLPPLQATEAHALAARLRHALAHERQGTP